MGCPDSWLEKGEETMAEDPQSSRRPSVVPALFVLVALSLGSGPGLSAGGLSMGSPIFPDDSLFSYVRIYADPQGESHFEDVEADLSLMEPAPGIAPMHVSAFFDASRFAFLNAETGWREGWHTAPQRQFLVYLAGVTEFQVSDGEIRRLGPGTILLAEDTTGKGHTSEVVSEDAVKAVLIQPQPAG